MADGGAPVDAWQWVITVGMALGAGVVGAVMRSGWHGAQPNAAGPGAPGDRNAYFDGTATIADMQPVRDLIKQIDAVTPRLALVVTSLEGLATQQGRSASAIERLAQIVEDYIENQENERDNEEEVRRRVAEALSGKEHKDAIRREVRTMRARESRTSAAKKRAAKPTEG